MKGGESILALLEAIKNDMAEKIAMVLKDDDLRSRLKVKGFERIKYFSLEKAAKKTLKVFEEVYNS